MKKVLLAALLGCGFLVLLEPLVFAAGVTAVCDLPGSAAESNCIKPNADGSINTSVTGGGNAANRANAAAQSYSEGATGSNAPLSEDLSGNLRVIVPSSQLVQTGNASALSATNLSVGTLPLNAAGDPYTQATLNITSATTTTVVSGTAAQTVRIYAIVLTCAAAQTIDIQSTGGTSRTGGALTCSSGGSVVLDPFPTGSARWTSVSGEGIQFVTSTSGTIHGTVWYIKS